MTTPTVAVSIAIPCYRNESSLANTLDRILECHPLPREILLHYDGGWEPEQDLALNRPVPFRVFRSSDNLGPGGGRDLMYRAAACDIVISFDDDSWPIDRDFFQRALAVMEAFPNAAVMSPAVYLREKPLLPTMAEASEGVTFEGSASVTRRSHYLKLPGYVPVPDAYGVEEVDISLQAHAAGFQILQCPWLRAWHDRPYADYQHGLVPWVKNEVLLAYLRYPRWLQPWGWLRSVRHVLNHYSPNRLGVLLRALAVTPSHCQRYARHRRRYSIREIWRHHFSPFKRWNLIPMPESQQVQVVPAPPSRRALYVQYTNPAAYPPLEHSSQMLASSGWEVAFMGVSGRGSTKMDFPPFPRISVHSMRWCAPGLKQKLHYLRFVWWTALTAFREKPAWIYCSDPLSASAGLLAQQLSGARIVYHEHDTPAAPGHKDKWFARFVWRQRRLIARRAQAVVVPNQARLDSFLAENPTQSPAFCVWNCPSRFDIPDQPTPRDPAQPLRVLYHGSIVPERFPVLILEALAACGRNVTIRLIGYEVPGVLGYTDQLKAEARRLGVADRFEYLGTMSRYELLPRCAECDVGLSLLRYQSQDINMRHMTGASNKPFDYLSQGLALIVPSEPEWEKLFVDNGCARACDPASKDELAALFCWLADHRDEVAAMGARGRQLIAGQWNYEHQFQPVLKLMEDSATNR